MARDGECSQAIDAFSEFLIRWPDHPFADHAMYWRGECILRNGDVRRAATEFEGLIARFAVGSKVPDALYKLVQCYERLNDEAHARQYASRLLRDFPQSEVAARLRAERTPR
jgi:tol-pal system protein YbgF